MNDSTPSPTASTTSSRRPRSRSKGAKSANVKEIQSSSVQKRQRNHSQPVKGKKEKSDDQDKASINPSSAPHAESLVVDSQLSSFVDFSVLPPPSGFSSNSFSSTDLTREIRQFSLNLESYVSYCSSLARQNDQLKQMFLSLKSTEESNENSLVQLRYHQATLNNLDMLPSIKRVESPLIPINLLNSLQWNEPLIGQMNNKTKAEIHSNPVKSEQKTSENQSQTNKQEKVQVDGAELKRKRRRRNKKKVVSDSSESSSSSSDSSSDSSSEDSDEEKTKQKEKLMEEKRKKAREAMRERRAKIKLQKQQQAKLEQENKEKEKEKENEQNKSKEKGNKKEKESSEQSTLNQTKGSKVKDYSNFRDFLSTTTVVPTKKDSAGKVMRELAAVSEPGGNSSQVSNTPVGDAVRLSFLSPPKDQNKVKKLFNDQDESATECSEEEQRKKEKSAKKSQESENKKSLKTPSKPSADSNAAKNSSSSSASALLEMGFDVPDQTSTPSRTLVAPVTAAGSSQKDTRYNPPNPFLGGEGAISQSANKIKQNQKKQQNKKKERKEKNTKRKRESSSSSDSATSSDSSSDSDSDEKKKKHKGKGSSKGKTESKGRGNNGTKKTKKDHQNSD
jgi:hypothetical protein